MHPNVNYLVEKTREKMQLVCNKLSFIFYLFANYDDLNFHLPVSYNSYYLHVR